jgi:hypothetical protein
MKGVIWSGRRIPTAVISAFQTGENGNNDKYNNSNYLKVGCLHPVACTRSGAGFPSNATLLNILFNNRYMFSVV